MDAIPDSETIVIAMLMTLVLGIIIGSNGLSAASTGKRTLILWRVEAKLDLLLKHADLAFDPTKACHRGSQRLCSVAKRFERLNSTARPPGLA